MEETILSLSMISHELKNPLAMIRSTLQLIESRHLEITKDPLWTQIYVDVDYMSRLLSELSVLNLESTVKTSLINVRQMMTDIEGMFASEMIKQKKALILRCQREGIYLKGDELRIRQMLINLIQNAVDATVPGDCIEVVSEIKENKIWFHVCDTGCGMDVEQKERLFCPFVTSKPNGTGLGMVIVKRIVDCHDGDILVQSSKDSGTKISVVFSEER